MMSRYLSLLAGLSCVACSDGASMLSQGIVQPVTSGDSVTMSADRGVQIARDSLTTIDQNPFPCCAMDSAGVHVQVTGGSLTFYAAASYAEMVIPPGGPKPRACVQGVGNGSHIGINNLVTLLDGTSYLMLSCTAGYFTVTLNQQLGLADGSSSTRQVTLATGRYGWQRDLMSLTEQGTAIGATASMSGATITVTAQGHRYSFLALSRF